MRKHFIKNWKAFALFGFAVSTLAACLSCAELCVNFIASIFLAVWNPNWITNQDLFLMWHIFTASTAIAVCFAFIRLLIKKRKEIISSGCLFMDEIGELWILYAIVCVTVFILYATLDHWYIGIGFVATAMVLCFFRGYVIADCVKDIAEKAEAEELEKNSETFESWVEKQTPESILHWAKEEKPIENSSSDYFDMEAVSERIVNQIRSYPQGISIGLMGSFGTGKSSIVNLVKEKLSRKSPEMEGVKYVFSVVSCWGFASSASALENILEQVLSDIREKGFSTFEIRNLPLQFVQEVTGNSTWYTRLFNLILSIWQKSEGFAGLLMRLADFLKKRNLHLVLVIEDIDRNDTNNSQFSATDILAAIHRLKNTENISLILSGKPSSDNIQIDFQKLCDKLEEVPFIDGQIKKKLFSKVAKYHVEHFPEDVYPKNFEIPAELESPQRYHENDFESFIQGDIESVNEGLSISLNQLSPRMAKKIIHHVDRLWNDLHGECGYIELWIFMLLKISSTDIYGFLIENIGAFRSIYNEDKPSDADIRSNSSVEIFLERTRDCIAQSNTDSRVIHCYLNYLFPGLQERLTGKQSLQTYETTEHSFVIDYPVDYFRRIVSGKKPDEFHSDQRSLRAIKKWGDGEKEPLVHVLRDCTEKFDDRYSRWLKNFSGNDILELTQRVLSEKVDAFGKDLQFDRGCEVLFDAWYPYQRMNTVSREAFLEWFPAIFKKAFSANICFAADVYWYFVCTHEGNNSTGSRGLPLFPFGEHYEGDIRTINQSFIRVAKEVLASSEAIIENCYSGDTLAKDSSGCSILSHLIHYYYDDDNGNQSHFPKWNKASDFHWLAELLWDGYVSEIPKIHNLIQHLKTDLLAEELRDFWQEHADEMMS